MKTKTYLIMSIALLMGVSAGADDVWNYKVYDDCSMNGYKVSHVSAPPADLQAVDLGLPSGLKWASCNVGATTPEESGGYYAWGEITPKQNYYMWTTYKYAYGSKLTKYCYDAQCGDSGFTDKKTTLDSWDDAAHMNWGGAWRMPTNAEWEELIENCTWTWTTQNSVNGYRVTSKANSNSIFLPAAGYCDFSNLYPDEFASVGYYWSSSLYQAQFSTPYNAYSTHFDSDRMHCLSYPRNGGLSVRAVCP